MLKDTYILGTALTITVILNVSTATTATITIRDPGKTVQVDSANMTRDNSNVYSYVYQTNENLEDGTWTALVSITYGGYTSVSEKNFEMRDRTK